MKRQIAEPPVPEIELDLEPPPPAGETVEEEQAELSTALERSVSQKRREIRPLSLVLTVLGLALLILIPLLLLLQRLQS